MLAHQVSEATLAQGGDLGRKIRGIQDVIALLVDHLALVVGDVVVLEQLLADVEVASLDLALRALDAAGDDTRLDGLALRHLETVHDGLDPVACKDAHQRIVQAQEEARGARIALAARAATQLVVNAARLVTLGGDDAQPALGHHALVVFLPLLSQRSGASGLGARVERGVGLDRLDRLLHVAAQHDVGAAASHVGRDGDHAWPTSLGHDVGLAGVLLGVEHLVRQLGLRQKLGDQLRVLDRGGAHQHRLATGVAVADVVDGGVVLLARRLVDAVELVVTAARAVGGDHHRLEAVDLLELVGLGVGGAGHARQLAVETEVVLEGDRGHGLVLGLDRHPLLGFHGLVQAVAPAAA